VSDEKSAVGGQDRVGALLRQPTVCLQRVQMRSPDQPL
jgi:hypothetical protein